MPAIASKVGKLTDIGEYIKPGSFVALGGGWSCNKPMAVVREIIRQKITGLKTMSIVGGWEMEWLLAAGAVDHLVFSFLSLESFGLPPHFRRAAEKKTIKLTEIEGCSMIKGLQARRAGASLCRVQRAQGIRHHPGGAGTLQDGHLPVYRQGTDRHRGDRAGCGRDSRPEGGHAGQRADLRHLGVGPGHGERGQGGDRHGRGDCLP